MNNTVHTAPVLEAEVHSHAVVDTVGIDDATAPIAPLAPLDPKRLRRNPLFTRFTWALLAALLACGAFALGARSKQNDSAGGFPGLPGGLPAGLAGGGAGGGLPDIAALLGGGGGAGGVNAKQLAAASTSSGEIVLIQAGKIYVRMSDGSTKAVAMTSGTSVMTGTATGVDKLAVGQQVIIDGRAEESGVVAANKVVVTP
jgi:hypothetical protein